MIGFILKKFVSRLLFPLPLASMLLLLGFGLLCCSKRQRTGRALVGLGIVLLLATAYGIPGTRLLRQIEWQEVSAETGQAVPDAAGAAPAPEWIVVLGNSTIEGSSLPANSVFQAAFLARFVEGVRLARQHPEAAVLLSLPGRLPEAEKRRLADELCATLALDRERLHLMMAARDTVDEARQTAAMAGAAPVCVVTSAAHLPRAVALFRGAGLRATGSPTDFLTAPPGPPRPAGIRGIYPNGRAVLVTETAVYETLGSFWTRLRRQTAPAPPR